jgi:hypothetical protein
MTAPATPAARRLGRTSAYWIITVAVVAECAIGGTMDLLRLPPFYPAMIDRQPSEKVPHGRWSSHC